MNKSSRCVIQRKIQEFLEHRISDWLTGDLKEQLGTDYLKLERLQGNLIAKVVTRAQSVGNRKSCKYMKTYIHMNEHHYIRRCIWIVAFHILLGKKIIVRHVARHCWTNFVGRMVESVQSGSSSRTTKFYDCSLFLLLFSLSSLVGVI